MIQTIPVINNKGGVGKTTTAVNVAAGLAKRNRQVLLVDLDSQGSASLSLGVRNNDLTPSIADALFGSRTLRDVIRPTDVSNLDLVTGSLDLADADVRLKDASKGHAQLSRLIASVNDDYDHVIVDCPPSTSMLSINALVAADAFLIPVSPSYLALEGLVSLGKVVRRVRQNMGEAAPVLGIVVTAIDPESEELASIIEQLRNHYGGKVFDTLIRRDPKVESAPQHSQDVFSYAPDSPGAEDYGALVDEIVDRIDRYGPVYETINDKHGSRNVATA